MKDLHWTGCRSFQQAPAKDAAKPTPELGLSQFMGSDIVCQQPFTSILVCSS
jgi:hypothetical protein